MIKKVIATTALMAVGLFTSLGYAAVAQTDRPAPSPNQPAPERNQTTQPSPNNQIGALDRQFIMEAAHGGMAEVRLGQLALERSTNPEVKQFAQQMIQEHTRANEELMRIATQKGVTPPTEPGPKYEAAMMRLMGLSGESFDEAYMNEAGVNSHLESVAIYQRQAALGQDRDLQAFAARILPRIQGHFEMASAMTGYNIAQRNNARPGMQMNRSQNDAGPARPGTQRQQ